MRAPLSIVSSMDLSMSQDDTRYIYRKYVGWSRFPLRIIFLLIAI